MAPHPQLPHVPPDTPRGETHQRVETRIRRVSVDIAQELAARFSTA